jgi:opacity protein-like surface antigen
MRALGTPATPALLAALAVLVAPVAGRAAPRPELYVSAGTTLAVIGPPNDGGGLAAAAAALWPVEDHFAFGLTAFADDLGATFGQLHDPNDPTVVLGTAELSHRSSLGAAWRLDARLEPASGPTLIASGTWGYARVVDDHRGDRVAGVGSTGFGLGAGARYSIFKSNTVGLMIRYQRLFNDRAGRYVSAGVEWGWR